jgi:gliding motility-associated-like protein
MNTYFRGKVLINCLLFCLLIFNVCGQSNHVLPEIHHEGHEHISFIENKRQWDEKIKFKSEMRGGALFFEANGITCSFYDPDYLDKIQAFKSGAATVVLDSLVSCYAYRMGFLGANTNTTIEGFTPMEEYHNYYIGSDTAKWASRVKKYRQIRYEQLYQGIDLLFYEEHHTYKYEFIVKKGANPSLIRIHYEGADELSVKKNNLTVKIGKHETIERNPFAYQISETGEKQAVDCKFVLDGKVVYFSLGKYDTNRTLIIDPTLIFASFTGSTADNWGYSATYDNTGCLYGGGTVYAMGYPVTLGAFQQTYGGDACDIAITKFNSNGTQALFATYLGGASADAPHSLIVNENDELYVLATTSSSNYPTTVGAYDVTFNGGSRYTVTGQNNYIYGSDVVISCFNAFGTQLLGSTYFGGSGNDGLNIAMVYNYADEIRGEIELDGNGNVYVVSSTSSSNLPVTSGVFQSVYGGGTQDGFIAKFSSNLQYLQWCSYFGGNLSDAIYSMELDANNNIYICGGTTSSNLPTHFNAISPSYIGGRDGFIAKIAVNGSSVLGATYYGRMGYDQVHLLTLDKEENVIVFGQSDTTALAWVLNAGWYNGSGQFISKLSNDLTQVIWSTSFGNTTPKPDISPTALMVDICDHIHISGWGGTSGNSGLTTYGLPVTANALQTRTDGSDFYFLSLNADASNLIYATYFGGSISGEHVDGGTSRFDKKGCIYQAVCAGCGGRSDFPVTTGVIGPTNNSWNCNLGVIKLDFNLQTVIADFSMPSIVCTNVEINFENRSKSVSDTAHYLWDFGDGVTDTAQNPIHVYLNPGSYDVTLTIYDYSSCNIVDTITKKIIVGNNRSSALPDIDLCKRERVQIGVRPSSDTQYEWFPFFGLSNNTVSNPIFIDTVPREYILLVRTSVCVDTFFQKINIIDVPKGENITLLNCPGDTVHFVKDTFQMDAFIWSSNASFSDTLNGTVTNPCLDVILQQPTSIYYLQRTKDKCIVLDTLQLHAASFQLAFDTLPKFCLGDTIDLDVKIQNPQHCSSFTCYWKPVNSIIGNNQSDNILVFPQSSMYFNVSVTNEHNCSASDSVLVEIVILKSDITLNSISCYGLTDGMIHINMSGGDMPYSYQWRHTTVDTAYLENLQRGLYTVKITDSNNCVMDTSMLITEPYALSLALKNTVDTVYCNEICNGEALAVVSGGTFPYSFAWITGDTTAYIDSLCVGDYFLLLTDGHGCQDSLQFEVRDTSSMRVDYVTDPETCIGRCDGSIQIHVTEAVFPYIYRWKRGDTSDFVGSLCAGVYDISVTDAQLCTRRIFPKVSSPAPVTVDSVIIVHPYCHGMKDGSIKVHSTGGNPPYTYFWDGVLGTNVLSDLEKAGVYTLRIVDSNGCEMDTVFILLDYDTLSIDYKTKSILCKEQCTGTITVSASGGVSPYTYLWFDGNTDTSLENLCSGEYAVTAYDYNGCSTEALIEIALDTSYFPQNIQVWADTTVIYRSQSTTLYGSNYGNKFDYTWSPIDYLNTNKGTKAITTPKNTITYTYTVSDGYGCFWLDTILITVLDVICEEPYVFVPNAFSPNGDSRNDVLYVRGLVLEKVEFAVYDRWGEKVFETKDKNKGWDGIFRGKQCDPGVYVYYLDAVCIGGERYLVKGNVTLIR